MNKLTLKKPDGSEVVLDEDGLVSGYNNREIDPSWLARPQGSEQWERVGVLIGVEPSLEPRPSRTAQTSQQDQASTEQSQRLWRFGVAGFFIGALLGFLLRPSVPLVGQLPFFAVITRGGSLKGLDQMLIPAACTSFNYMLVGAILGAVAGVVATKLTTKNILTGT